MKVVILAGGYGTRLAERTDDLPKPMVEIGGRPILWHIMKHYAAHGFLEFVLPLGYKGDAIKRFFLDYFTLNGSMTIGLQDGTVQRHGGEKEPWVVDLIETGIETNTGGRVGRVAPWLGQETFMLTYGDGVSNIDIRALLEFHRRHGRMATITAVRPQSRFGQIVLAEDRTARFEEKPQIGEGWINGGFMVLEPEILEFVTGDGTSLEADVLEAVSRAGQLVAYPHEEFWQCMDTLRDVRYLESLWEDGDRPWVTWS